MTRHRSNAREALTVIEVMIALAILGMVAALLFASLQQTQQNKARTEAALDRSHLVVTTMERIARELETAFVSVHVNRSPSLQAVRPAFIGKDGASNDRIDFTSFSHLRLFRDAHESDQSEIGYFVTRDPKDSSKRVLARREANRIDDDATKGGEVQVVMEGIEEFQIEYLDFETRQWVTAWDTLNGIGQQNRLPAQVKVILTVTDPTHPRGKFRIATRAVLPLRYALNHAVYYGN